MSQVLENRSEIDLGDVSLREVNSQLQSAQGGHFRLTRPKGCHALACGLNSPLLVEIQGHTGYYCAGMNQRAKVLIHGNAGQGVAENMMSGEVWVHGDCSQSAAAAAHGGLLVIEGNAAARCGISLKGADIVVKGNAGHMSMFMAQAGRLVVMGDAGDALGDSLYEARIYVRGKVKSLGADCIEKEMGEQHRLELRELLDRAGSGDAAVSDFRRYGSARKLYRFNIDNMAAY